MEFWRAIKECLEFIGWGACKEIYVVDNASTDGSEIAAEQSSEVALIRSTKNLGFAKACNLGAANASSDLLLFLNPDTVVYPGALEKVYAFFNDPDHSDVGICGIQLLDKNSEVARSCARFPTPMHFLLRVVGLDLLFPRLGQFMVDWAHDSTREVDQVIGAFFVIRKNLFHHLNGFDESFFMYFEEVDLAYRARLAGWRCIYYSDAQSFHYGGGTSNQVKANRLFYQLRSRLIYAHKHFGMLGFSLTCFVTLFVEPFSRSFYSIICFSIVSFFETWSGFSKLYKWLFHAIFNWCKN